MIYVPSPGDFATVQQPRGGSYTPPDLSAFFQQGIGNLPEQYGQGAELGQKMRMMQPVIDPETGKPVDVVGNPQRAYQLIMQEGVKRGGLNYAQQLLPFLMLQGSNALTSGPSETGGAPEPYAGGQTSQNTVPSNNSPHGAGPSNIDPNYRPQTPPYNTSSGAPGTPVVEGGSSGPTPRSIARHGGDETQVGPLARALRVGPDQILTDDQALRATGLMRQRQTGASPRELAYASTEGPTTAGSPTTVPSSEDITQPTGPTSAYERGMLPVPGRPPPQGASGQPAPQTNAPGTTAVPSGIAPQGLPSQPQRVAQAGPPANLPPGAPANLTPQRAQQLADQYRQKAAQQAAAAALTKNPQLISMSQESAKIAEQYREFALGQNKRSPEELEAARQGVSTVGLAGNKKLAQDDATAFTKQRDTYLSLGQNAAAGLPKVQFAQALINDPNFYSGVLQPTDKTFKQFAVAFGADPNKAMPQEAFNKVVNDLLQEQVKAMGQSGVGRVLMAEVNIMRESIASLGITPASNRLLVELLSRTYQKNLQLAEMAGNYRGVADGNLNSGLQLNAQRFVQSHPMFTQQELNDPRLIAPPTIKGRGDFARFGVQPGDPIIVDGQRTYWHGPGAKPPRPGQQPAAPPGVAPAPYRQGAM